ncbi:MAG: bifunctional demethylmenaquinone methyltransferase/2-methoxy-6-polyprenyl-1,4-benzoquinol methylase UbiE [Gammaproteobacteria bacterium]|nr:bifunctional demethylmenaquinone methyltransferase/2-methoxy-6-polyprenyl-1,4-benzoquinol methylase UbiE [Gammaproteobacteria bacterium]
MKKNDSEKLTDFGYQQVSAEQKATLVKKVFTQVAQNYDLMNDLMSLGIHRFWKRFALKCADIHSNQVVLDVAAGTGDVSALVAEKLHQQGQLCVTDINEAMLLMGRNKLIDRGFVENIAYVQSDAEKLPFLSNYFDCIFIAFGLRNVTHKEAALASFFRVLKPGGRLIILEFSKPILPFLNKAYDRYSFSVLPWLGKVIAKDEASYRYLAESIRKHPDQETLKERMSEAGFEDSEYFNLTGGVVAVHRGFKY